MFSYLKRLLTENLGLKTISLLLALIAWFYIVNELEKGSEEEMQALRKMLPSEDIAGKKLDIIPVLIGRPRTGHEIVKTKVVVNPDYCIVVGARDMLRKVKSAYTVPIDVSGVDRTFTKSVSLSPIAPGVYLEETFVQVTVPIERSEKKE